MIGVTEKCWKCGKSVRVPADNNNIYTRICAKCVKEVVK